MVLYKTTPRTPCKSSVASQHTYMTGEGPSACISFMNSPPSLLLTLQLHHSNELVSSQDSRSVMWLQYLLAYNSHILARAVVAEGLYFFMVTFAGGMELAPGLVTEPAQQVCCLKMQRAKLTLLIHIVD